MRFLRPLFVLLCNCIAFLPALPAGNPADLYRDHIFRETVKTVLLYKEGWELSYPVIELNSQDRLVLSFDDLADKVSNFSYTLIHCNAYWNPSPISQNEYIDGFTEAQLTDYSYSFNTTVPYIHYHLVIPNENMNITCSGNYILLVFDEYDRNQPVITRRFSVFERQVTIETNIHRPSLPEYHDSGQEVDISVHFSSMAIDHPEQEIILVIRQNGRWDNMLNNLKPLFYKNNLLVYDYNLENIFPGGNEFRYFDIKSLRFQTEYIRNISLIKPYYHVELVPSTPRINKPYFFENELNGKYYIHIQEGRDSETDADYVYVYFTLPYDIPFTGGKVYLFGALTGWDCQKENEMIYNYESRAYELTLLLKQGFYSYEYAFLSDKQPVANPEIIEGSHYQTENDYLVYVYYREHTSRFDRLIGMDIKNTQNPE
jgi:hypothetical protein